MEYEPIKERVSRWIEYNPILRKLFFRILGVLILREWYVKKILRDLPFAKREKIEVLDAGCGFGQYSYYCAKRFPCAKVLGLEMNPKKVASGNRFTNKVKMENLEFQKGDITKIPYQHKFHLILAVDVLEHIREDEEVLARFFRALKSEGYLVISTPTIYRKHGEDGAFVEEHYRAGYSEEEITRKLTAQQFVVHTITYGYGFWGDLSWRLGIRNTIILFGSGWIGKLLAPLYLIFVSPVMWFFMILDYYRVNRRGTGFVIVTRKAQGNS